MTFKALIASVLFLLIDPQEAFAFGGNRSVDYAGKEELLSLEGNAFRDSVETKPYNGICTIEVHDCGQYSEYFILRGSVAIRSHKEDVDLAVAAMKDAIRSGDCESSSFRVVEYKDARELTSLSWQDFIASIQAKPLNGICTLKSGNRWSSPYEYAIHRYGMDARTGDDHPVNAVEKMKSVILEGGCEADSGTALEKRYFELFEMSYSDLLISIRQNPFNGICTIKASGTGEDLEYWVTRNGVRIGEKHDNFYGDALEYVLNELRGLILAGECGALR